MITPIVIGMEEKDINVVREMIDAVVLMKIHQHECKKREGELKRNANLMMYAVFGFATFIFGFLSCAFVMSL